MNTEEAALQRDIVKWLSRPQRGVFIAQVNRTFGEPANTGTTPGFPDLVVMCNGSVELWELKRPRRPGSREGRLSAAQKAFHEAAAGCGVHIRIVRSFEEARQRIEELRAEESDR